MQDLCYQMVADLLPKKMPPQTQRTRPKTSSARLQAIAMQRVLLKDALESPNAKDRATAARVWCDLNEEVRKLAMRPVPRPIDTTKMPKRGHRSASVAPEPVEPGPTA